MWSNFWRTRNRFSLEELQYLTDQLQKVQIVNEVNKDFIIEALRSIAELVTYGDQHDPSFFEFFMEKQIMGEFVRILRISRPAKVALQLLQTMSIMIQNLRSEHAIYYIFSNEHINQLITFSFDFKNDELLSHYISFLRAISGKLNKNTISLLVNTQDLLFRRAMMWQSIVWAPLQDEVISFPLYVEGIRFAFHEESMVRTAVRALTLNIYHVGDVCVNSYVSRSPLSDFFSNMIKRFRKQCIDLDTLVSQVAMNSDSSDLVSHIITAVDEIEDTLYYFSDVISSGVPDLGSLITDNILELLVFPLFLPCLKRRSSVVEIGCSSSLYLLCCILRIVKTKDLASTTAAALFYPPETFNPKPEVMTNGYCHEPGDSQNYELQVPNSHGMQAGSGSSEDSLAAPSGSSGYNSPHCSSSQSNSCCLDISSREMLLSYIITGDDVQVLSSLNLLATLLQTKELDESMLDGLGILPQRRQHKKLLLQALAGEVSGEEQLFSSDNSILRDNTLNELDKYLHNLKDRYGQLLCCGDLGINPRRHRYQVLDALVSLFCRDNLSSETLWTGGWLFRQLLPHGEEESTANHLKKLKDSNKHTTAILFEEIKGSWCDILVTVLVDEWRNCKRAIEAASPQKDPKSMLLPSRLLLSGGESSFIAGERMCEVVKVFVLQRQLLFFSSGGSLHDLPTVTSPKDSPEYSRAKTAGFNGSTPKPGSEINLENSIPCRIAFERGKERQFCFLAFSWRTSGWVLLAEELPMKQRRGLVRVTAPLAGCEPRIDDKHLKWLHLRIRPSNLSFQDPSKYDASVKGKVKVLVDGRWTLAFRDEQACKSAEAMIIEEMHLQSSEVEKRLRPFLELEMPGHAHDPSNKFVAEPAVG